MNNNNLWTKGTSFFFNEDAQKIVHLNEIFSQITNQFGFSIILLPKITTLKLMYGVGSLSDIVNKEMFELIKKGNQHNVLRPEITSQIMYVFLTKYHHINNFKVWYFDSCFRYERPQYGRKREFYQFGVEWINTTNQLMAIISIVLICFNLLENLKLKTKISFHINYLGSSVTKKHYINYLQENLSDYSNKLCKLCQKRLLKNAMRIFDCKVCSKLSIVKRLKSIQEFLLPDEQIKYKQIKDTLSDLNIQYVDNSKLVRGIDYYTDFVFEIKSQSSDLTVIAGGEYNELATKFVENPKKIRSVGFAGGVERLLELCESAPLIPQKMPQIFVCCLKNFSLNADSWLLISELLQCKFFNFEVNLNQLDFKKHLQYASNNNFLFIIVFAPCEWKNKQVIVKNLQSQQQILVNANNVVKYLCKNRC